MRIALHWFRRDLRLVDNTALAQAAQEAEAVIPVVILDEQALASPVMAPARIAAMTGAIEDIADRLARGGGARLIVRVGDTANELVRIAREVGATDIYTNRSEGSHAAALESAVASMLQGAGISLRLYDDLGVVPPDAIQSASGAPYMAYTPYAKRWREALTSEPPAEHTLRRDALTAARDVASILESVDVRRALADRGYHMSPWESLWGGGRTAHLARMKQFIEDPSTGLSSYVFNRDLPAQPGTSRLSAALRWGTISAREAWRMARAWADSHPEAKTGADTWIGELAWADFYRAVLYSFPQSEHEALKPAYNDIAWHNDEEHFARWAEGRTGYPIVDAGMRQLRAEGWMHNRARMIVASFLVKDLLLDWRLGERHFMRHLVDGSIAANVGNWQWAASTGTDAQPWFRIFNPVTQGRRFDPTGEYVRRYIPELARIPATSVHEPWKLSVEEQRRVGVIIGREYPAPIVDHSAQRALALAMFREVKQAETAD